MSIQTSLNVYAANISALQATVVQQHADIQRLNDTTREQRDALQNKDLEIEDLRHTVHTMNTTLAALAAAVGQLTKATTFAPATSGGTTAGEVPTTDCTPAHVSKDEPCVPITDGSTATSDSLYATLEGTSHTTDTTLMPTLDNATTVLLPDVMLAACDTFPCSDDQSGVFAWGLPVAVVASVDAVAVEFQFALLSDDDNAVWTETSSSRFASFVPSDIGVTSIEEYELRAVVTLEDGRRAEAVSATALRFAAPPTLRGIDVQWINGSAAASWFEVVVDAADTSELLYEYFVAAADGSWTYFVASDSNGTVTVAVPSTRNWTLAVTITNVFGSSVFCDECATLSTPPANASSVDVRADALHLVGAGVAGTGLLLAVIDTGGGDDSVAETLLHALSGDTQTDETSLSQDVVVLNALVHAGLVTGVADVLQAIAARITLEETPDSSLSLYLDTVDAYSSVLLSDDGSQTGVAEMDENLAVVCAASEAGSVPDGEVSVFPQDSVTLSCASTEDIVAVDAGAAAVLASVAGVSTVVVSTWNGTINATTATTNTTTFMSAIHGVHIEGARQEGDIDDIQRATTLKLSLSDRVNAVRKAVSCMYFDETARSWSGRGVVLRGMEFLGNLEVRAICASSHLTLFTVADSSEAAKVVATKIAAFADRVDSMNSVNLLDDGAAVNWSVMGVFISITLFFGVVIVVAKIMGRQVAVDRGRLTFQQDGQLSKPSVMGSRQYEAVLRRWLSGANAAKLVVFELLTSNAVLGLLFHWDHEAVVYGRADKAVILFSAILMTFVSSAFLFDPNESASEDLMVVMWSTLVTAVLTNVLLLPVQHVLPYMVSNVNSLVTLTRMPTTLLKRELKRLSCWKPAGKRPESDEVFRSMTLVASWVAPSLNAVPRHHTHNDAHGSQITHVSTKLHFLRWIVELPSTVTADQSHGKVDVERTRVSQDAIVSFQRQFRSNMRWRRALRDLEFGTWHDDLRRERHVLAMLSAAVLVVLAAFTLAICLLLSCAFSEEESLMWAGDVAQSLVMQVFVTDPAITLLLMFAKLFVSFLLLRVGKKRLKKQLKEKAAAVNSEILTITTQVEAAAAKATALQVVSAGNATVVAQEKATKTAEKQKCLATLDDIAVAKSEITRIRQLAVKPQKIKAEAWDTRESELNAREQQTRGSLHAIEAALDILDGDHEDAKEELLAAKETIAHLKRQLAKMAQENVTLRRAQAKIDDKPSSNVKNTAIVPMGAAMGTDHNEEPDAERAAMPALQRAVRLCDEVSLIGQPASESLTDSRRRQLGPRHATRQTAGEGRRRRQRRRRSMIRAEDPAVQGDSEAHFNELVADEATMKPSVSRKRGPMSWAQIRALQRALKAKAARSPTQPTRRRRPRRPGTMHLSPKAAKVVLERRERRRQLLNKLGQTKLEESCL